MNLGAILSPTIARTTKEKFQELQRNNSKNYTMCEQEIIDCSPVVRAKRRNHSINPHFNVEYYPFSQ